MNFHRCLQFSIFGIALAIAPLAMAVDAPSTPERRRVLVLPVSFPMSQMFTGGRVEPMRDWSQAAEIHLTSGLRAQIARNPGLELLGAPDLSEAERAAVREYVTLCRLIAENVAYVLDDGGRAWKDKLQTFDYSVGNGLAFLKNRTGADHALCLTGSKLQSNDGRKALALLGAVGGVGLNMGDASAALTLVELASGSIVWMERVDSVLEDVRTEAGANEVARKLLGGFPRSRLLQR